jgi:simple sugar transport system ATP-binding protein
LVISEELDELFIISDRLAVLAEGRLSPSVRPAETSIGQIGTWMSGKFGEPADQGAAAVGPLMEVA